jgi:hypothetical protein
MRVIAVLLASLASVSAADSIRAPARALRAELSKAETAADALGVSARARSCNGHGEGCFWSGMFGRGNCCEGLVCRNRADSSGLVYCLPHTDARFRAMETVEASASRLTPEEQAKIKFADKMAKFMVPKKEDETCAGMAEGTSCTREIEVNGVKSELYKGTCKTFMGSFGCVGGGQSHVID